MDPNRYKNAGILLADIRSVIEPPLLAAGFRLAGRNNPCEWRSQFIEYARHNELFCVTWDCHEARLAAELVTADGDAFREIASVTFSGEQTSGEIEDRLVPFMAALRTYLDVLRGSYPQQES